mmetsp:Transcript_70023/g.116713  ORF Transcript_70023/g.116713 Transcript_70023/m.116713 type:complete len:207 (-) Transcript_70023:651-1271(-)
MEGEPDLLVRLERGLGHAERGAIALACGSKDPLGGPQRGGGGRGALGAEARHGVAGGKPRLDAVGLRGKEACLEWLPRLLLLRGGCCAAGPHAARRDGEGHRRCRRCGHRGIPVRAKIPEIVLPGRQRPGVVPKARAQVQDPPGHGRPAIRLGPAHVGPEGRRGIATRRGDGPGVDADPIRCGGARHAAERHGDGLGVAEGGLLQT